MKKKSIPKLNLSDHETKTSRLFFFRVFQEAQETIRTQNTVALSRSVEDRNIWANLLVSDLIITVPLSSPLNAYCLKVIGKNIAYSETNKKCALPFILFFELIGIIKLKKLSNDLFFIDQPLFTPSRTLFKEYWESANSLNDSHKDFDVCLYKKQPYEVRIAQNEQDFQFINNLA